MVYGQNYSIEKTTLWSWTTENEAFFHKLKKRSHF